jgi:phage shock protein A
MGLIERMSTLFHSKVNKILDKFEDPRETLDYSYTKQLELLQRVKTGVVEVAAAKKRLESQKSKLETNVANLDSSAKEAVKMSREDLARIALERKIQTLNQLSDLSQQINGLDKEQKKLEAAVQNLSLKIDAFRSQKEVIKAQYSSAEAQVKVTEAVSGISEEMGDVGFTIDRATQKTEEMQARASALDELVEKGTIQDLTTAGKDEIGRELDKIRSKGQVEQELESLKKEVGK